jgi:phosphatidylglycerol:prolipoprotein diacylglycerol transferase
MKRLVRSPRLWGAAGPSMTVPQVDDFFLWSVLGVVAGGRLGYVLFYKPLYYLGHPLDIFRLWDGGMSFHGGFLGVVVACILFGRKIGTTLDRMLDLGAASVPVGLGLGRVANFINGELWGRVTDLPWGMVFRQTGDGLPRHPSQLYEAALEGVALFVIVWLFSAKPRPTMAVSGVFALAYGIFRFLVEFVRQPDPQLGYLAFGWLTMGQVLSLPLIAVGAVLLSLAYRRRVS